MLSIFDRICAFFSSAIAFLPDAALIVLIPAVLALVFFAGRQECLRNEMPCTNS